MRGEKESLSSTLNTPTAEYNQSKEKLYSKLCTHRVT